MNRRNFIKKSGIALGMGVLPSGLWVPKTYAQMIQTISGGGTTTGYLGYSSAGTASTIGAADRQRMFKVTVPNAGTLKRIREYMARIDDSVYDVKWGVWRDDGSGNRGTLIGTAECAESIADNAFQWTSWYDLSAEAGQNLDVSESEVVWFGGIYQNPNTDYSYQTVTSGDAEYDDGSTFPTLTSSAGVDTTRAQTIQVEYEY